MIERLGSVWLEVADLERSLGFYRDALRFDVLRRMDESCPLAVLRAGSLRLTLAQSGAGGTTHRGMQLTIEVAGLDAYYHALVSRGLHPTPPVDEETVRRFTVRDPDGLEWRFEQSLA